MAKSAGDIAVNLTANTSKFDSGMDRAARSMRDFEGRTARVGRRLAGMTVAATAAGVALAGRVAVGSVEAAREIRNLSNLAGVGAEQFQRLAAAADTVGINQDKLADIFKDTSDKFGDFMTTGAGPLKDFFEQIAPRVGVTAEQFARLSGPEALQLYVKSLEEAGVSQQQMTFYMEALASDATALIPLLRDNGRAMRELGQEADNAGRVIDEALIQRGAELGEKWRGLMQSMLASTQSFALQAATAIDNAFGISQSGKMDQQTQTV